MNIFRRISENTGTSNKIANKIQRVRGILHK